MASEKHENLTVAIADLTSLYPSVWAWLMEGRTLARLMPTNEPHNVPVAGQSLRHRGLTRQTTKDEIERADGVVLEADLK